MPCRAARTERKDARLAQRLEAVDGDAIAVREMWPDETTEGLLVSRGLPIRFHGPWRTAQLLPMVQRVQKNDGFYEWYSVDNKPRGSGTFRGSAGVLGKAIEMLITWARANEG